jgi:polyferredoxin
LTHTRRKPKSRQPLRLAVQIVFFVLVAAIAVNHTLQESGNGLPVLASASLHSLCPFGGVVSIYQYATTGTFVQKIHESSFILMIAGFALAILVGPAFCGWVCPFGSIQEWLGKLGRKLFPKRFNRLVPYSVDRWLRYLRYVVLAWVVFVTAWSAKLMFANIDPYYALFNFWTGEVALSALIVLGVVLLLSLVIERPFCKYACPYGATLGVFNLFRIFSIKRNKKTCISCGQCDTACPMNIPVSKSTVVRNHQCISCLKCTSEYACPVTNTVELQAGPFAEVEV